MTIAGRAPSRCLELAERVLDARPGRAADAEAEVTVRPGRAALTRFANGFIHQNVAEEREPRRCSGSPSTGDVADVRSTGRPDDDALGRLVDGALEAARVRPADPDWPGLAPPSRGAGRRPLGRRHGRGRRPTSGPSSVAAFVDAAGGLETAGFCSTDAVHVAFANSAGQRARPGAGRRRRIDGIARTPTADGSGRVDRRRPSATSTAPPSGERAAAQGARRARTRPTSSPGRYEVVLEPACVADIVGFLAGLRVQRPGGRGGPLVRPSSASRSSTRRSRCATTSPSPSTTGLPFDIEGTPKRPVDLVRAGVTTSPAPRPPDGREGGRRCGEHRVTRSRAPGPGARSAPTSSSSRRATIAGRPDRRRRARACSSPTSGTPGSSTRGPRS